MKRLKLKIWAVLLGIVLNLKSYIIEVTYIGMIQNNVFHGESSVAFRTTAQNCSSDCSPTLWSALSETVIMLKQLHVYLISSWYELTAILLTRSKASNVKGRKRNTGTKRYCRGNLHEWNRKFWKIVIMHSGN